MSLFPAPVAFFSTAGAAPAPSYDPSFSGSLGTGVDGGGTVRLYAAWGDSDGGMWVGGDATTYKGSTVDSVFKINNDGSQGVVCNTSSQNVRAVYADNNYVYVGYSAAPYFEVFDKSTGNVVSGWPSFNNQVRDIKATANGNIIVAGNFTTPHQNFTAIDPSTQTLPVGFTTHTFGIVGSYASEPRLLLVDSDDRILLGGPFGSIDSTTIHSGVRMFNDGTIDLSFDPVILLRGGTTPASAGPYIGYREVNYNGSKQYLAYGAFFEAWDGTQHIPCNNFALLNADGTLDSNWYANPNETGATANAVCVNNDTGHFYIQYGGNNQHYFNGIVAQNSNRTVLKFDLTNTYVGDANWMTNNVTTSHDPIYAMYSQEEWNRAPGSPLILVGHSAFTTYDTNTGMGSIVAAQPGNGAILTR